MAYTLVTPPSVEPLTVSEAKTHLRVTFSADDSYIGALITAVRQKLESHLSRSFITTGWRMTRDAFPGAFSQYSQYTGSTGYGAGIGTLFGHVPEVIMAAGGVPFVTTKARLIAVSAITYLDTAGTRQTLSSSAYTVEAVDGGRIVPAYGSTWPAARAYPGSIQVDMTMGYGPAATDVPECIKSAMKLLIGHLYANRSAVADAAAIELPLGVKYLVSAEDWGCRP